MGVSYKPLRHTLVEKELTITKLCNDLNIAPNIRTTLNNDTGYVSLSTVEKICKYLDVPIECVVKFTE